MRVTLGELRKLIAEEVSRVITEAKKKDDDSCDGPSPQAIADDSDVLLDDEEHVSEKKESFMVPPSVQKQLRHYFQAMGLDGKKVPHVRYK